jgi:hypothetical protein
LANTGGIKAPTGKHSVVLSKGTEELKRNFQLKKDPRWTQTHADILAQYELAMQVKSTFNNCHKSIGNLRSVRTQINNKLDLIKDKPGQNEVTERGKAIVQELNSIEEKLIQTKSESGQDPINYPSMIDDQIAYLYSVVNGNEGGATEGAKRRFSDLKEELSPILTELKTQKEAVEKWNQLLIEQGLGGVLTE